jgi:serine/threonine-protein kinase
LSAGGTDVPEAYEYYIQGRGYLQRYENVDNIDRATNLFKLASEKDSLYTVVYAGLGEAYWRKFEATKQSDLVERAIAECKKAFYLDSSLAAVNITLGIIYSGTGHYQEAIDHFNRALLNEPSNAAAYRGLAKVYETLENFSEAERTFKRAIGLKPDYWAGYNYLGVFYYKRGRYEDAIEQFKMVIKLTPDSYRGYNNLGGIYYMLERREDAREMFERSLAIHKSYNIYSNLGTLYYIEGKYEDAARTYELALALNDNDYLTWGNLAAAYFWIPGKKDKAIDTYKHAIEIAEERLKVNPKDPEVISNLARYYSDIGNEKKSLKLLKLSLEIAPDNVEVMYRAASIYENFGMRDDALLWIGNAIENGYSQSEIESQPELKQLVTDKRYQQLLLDKNSTPDLQ